MGTSRIPVEIVAPLGPRALDELGMTLTGLGYDPRSAGRELGQGPPARGDSPAISLNVEQALAPDAANALLEAVANWIRQRPSKPGRFRRRKPGAVSVTISGPSGEVLAHAAVGRSQP